jgi:hypothetical protein
LLVYLQAVSPEHFLPLDSDRFRYLKNWATGVLVECRLLSISMTVSFRQEIYQFCDVRTTCDNFINSIYIIELFPNILTYSVVQIVYSF